MITRSLDSLVEAPASPRTATAGPVLVFRSCRPHVLAAAVEAYTAGRPASPLAVLTHEHQPVDHVPGLAEVIRVGGRRFGIRETPLGQLLRLRARGFAEIVIPQMHHDAASHLNLYVLAWALGARRVTTYSPEHGLQSYSRPALRRLIRTAVPTLVRRLLDVPWFLALLAAAVVRPRRPIVASGAPRRVLHVITSWGVGGAQLQLAELVRRTPPEEWETDILVLARADGDFSSRHLGDRAVTIRYAGRWPSLAGAALEIAELCRTRRYDVVHTWLFLANVIGVAGARLAGVPRVISSVRNLSLWKRTWANQPWFRLADTLAAHASDIVTVNASPLVDDHARWARVSPRRIAIVPNGLSTNGLDLSRPEARHALDARLALPPTALVVGTVGRLAPEKAHDVLLEAWPAVAARHPNAHLVIAGDGPSGAALRRQAAPQASVHLVGESAEARALIAALDVFVLPSRIEGFANVLLEAAMLGTPILATDVGAARDVVQAPEDLVPVDDAHALAAGLVAHLDHLAAARARAARRQISVRAQFTADRMAARWFDLYRGADR